MVDGVSVLVCRLLIFGCPSESLVRSRVWIHPHADVTLPVATVARIRSVPAVALIQVLKTLAPPIGCVTIKTQNVKRNDFFIDTLRFTFHILRGSSK